MPPKRRNLKTYFKAFFPVALLLLFAAVALSVWLVRKTVYPRSPGYLVTPDGFRDLDARGLKVTNETWANNDNTNARGWLLRGEEGAPAVLLLHGYDEDRSWLLNLGVTLNSVTNFTVLWVDMRGHGPNPNVKWTSFGAGEAEDAAAALKFLRSLKTTAGNQLIGPSIGVYGLEMGAYAAIFASVQPDSQDVRALVLDSVPASPENVLQTALARHVGTGNPLFRFLAKTGAKIYLRGSYQETPTCNTASRLLNRNIMLLAGPEAPELRASTVAVGACLPGQNQIETYTDTAPLGFNLPYLPGSESDVYNRRVIDFFNRALRGPEISPRFRFPTSTAAPSPTPTPAKKP
jgi:pimeloyl-ACP methyl ester carboxylesterase